MRTVVFACVHNAGRSQMAVAFFEVDLDLSRARPVRAIRAEVRERVAALIESEGWGRARPVSRVQRGNE